MNFNNFWKSFLELMTLLHLFFIYAINSELGKNISSPYKLFGQQYDLQKSKKKSAVPGFWQFSDY